MNISGSLPGRTRTTPPLLMLLTKSVPSDVDVTLSGNGALFGSLIEVVAATAKVEKPAATLPARTTAQRRRKATRKDNAGILHSIIPLSGSNRPNIPDAA